MSLRYSPWHNIKNIPTRNNNLYYITMQCTQMRLAQRRDPRFTIPTQSNGVIQRPCLINNLEHINSRNTYYKSNGNNLNFELLTPRTKRNSNRKPPLIIFSLKMESDVKTLAQDDVKRDPRRLPFFCEQYKHNKKEQQHNTNNTKDSPLPTDKLSNKLMVRGVEMLSNPNSNNPEVVVKSSTEHEHNIDLYSNKYYSFLGDGKNFESLDCDMMSYPKDIMKIKLTDCCQCMRDVKLLKNNILVNKSLNEINRKEINDKSPNTKGQTDDATIVKNNISGSLKPLYPSFVLNFNNRQLKRIPSPKTRQIINITMNTKK